MAKTFMPVDRDQRFLLPPDMREWLPGDHLVWFFIDVVERLDLSRFEANYRLGAQGRSAYDPAMLLALLLYAYSQGVRSSRKLERACRTDIAYKVICGTYGQTPDHSTLCRFRRRHEGVIEDLFCQVLVTLHRLGMLPLGVIAIDGTKIEANAALDANRTVVAIKEEVKKILAEAEAADVEEDARFGDGRGDELPEDLVEPESREAHLLAALAYAEALLAEGTETEHDADSERRDPRVNVTDPDSRVMHSTDGYLQGYNAQVAVGDGQVVLACNVTNRRNDYGLFSPMVAAVADNLERAGVSERPACALGDAGYFDTDDLAPLLDDPDGPKVLVSTRKRHDQPDNADEGDLLKAHEAARAAVEEERGTEQQRRAGVYERVAAGELDMKQAQGQLGVSQPTAYAGYTAWRKGGASAIPVPRRPAGTKRPTKKRVVRQRLEQALAEPENRERYKRRGHLVEGFFAAHKHQRNGRWFSGRGNETVSAEFAFDCVVHNLLKMRTAIGTTLGFLAGGFAAPSG